ncbi:hypothetical protein CK507_07260 [Pseudomonas sp. WN033]|nr:hypothetical protein CK507_07260 [Pseudomonas sp. WN033]
MCLIAFAWQVADQPLLLLGNRDEFHARPTRNAQFWEPEGHPELLAGKDLEAGGTWLGITRQGRFASLTNIRAPGARKGPLSRGALVLDYLTGQQSPAEYLQQVAMNAEQYAGFNLLVGDRQQLWHLNSRSGQAESLSPGIYALSNAGLNSPWPKLVALRQGLEARLHADDRQLLQLLADPRTYPDEQLPDTGISLEWERLLSAAFIVSAEYGTRASSLLRLKADGEVVFIEQRFGPEGVALGEQRWCFACKDQ